MPVAFCYRAVRNPGTGSTLPRGCQPYLRRLALVECDGGLQGKETHHSRERMVLPNRRCHRYPQPVRAPLQSRPGFARTHETIRGTSLGAFLAFDSLSPRAADEPRRDSRTSSWSGSAPAPVNGAGTSGTLTRARRQFPVLLIHRSYFPALVHRPQETLGRGDVATAWSYTPRVG